MKQYRTRWFDLEELVSRDVFELHGEDAWELLDSRLLITLERLRVIYGPIYINDWAMDRDHEWNGLRTTLCPFYNPWDQHTFGRAANLRFENWTLDEVQNDILNQPNLKEFEHLRAIELGEDYLHIDVRNTSGVKVIKP